MNQEPGDSPCSAYILYLALSLVGLVIGGAALTAVAMGMFQIRGYFMPWNGPYDLFLKVNPILVGLILVGIAYALLKVLRRIMPREARPKERPWWQILP